MKYLPTKDELHSLHNRKGDDFLIWYIWRNAIRVLPIFGLLPLLGLIGSERRKINRQLYQSFQISFLLSRWEHDQKKLSDVLANKFRDVYSLGEMSGVMISEYKSARSSLASYDSISGQVAMGEMTVAGFAEDAIQNAVKVSIEITRWFREKSNIIDLAFLVSDLARGAEWSANAAIVGKEVVDRQGFSKDFDEVYHYASRYTDDFRDQSSLSAISESAKFDVETLEQYEVVPWFISPLWSPDFIEKSNFQVKKIERWADCLFNNLGSEGYDFIAYDLQQLLLNKRLGKHSERYKESFSSSIIDNPRLLKEQIFVGGGVNSNAVRVLLLGSGGAGKSTLADRLKGKKAELKRPATLGVDYFKHQPLNLDLFSSIPEPSQDWPALYLWDFGGQTIFHGFHSAFLSENSIYVLVVDSRHEQAPDEWLDQIHNLAGSQAIVLIVTNEYENCKIRQNETRLLREYEFLDEDCFYYFSCLDANIEEINRFVLALVGASQDSQRLVSQSVLYIQNILSQKFKERVFLSYDEIESIVKEYSSEYDAAEKIAEGLQQLGFIVKVNSDEEEFCLEPAWIVDYAYALVSSPLLREQKGIINLKQLKLFFRDKVKTVHIKHLFAFLLERSLCTKLQGSTEYFFPDASTPNEIPEATKIFKEKDNIVIRFSLPCLPLGLHARLVHNLFVPNCDVFIRDVGDIWRHGFILRKNGSTAVIHYLQRKNVIELVLSGSLTEFNGVNFSDLLNTFYVNLKSVISAGSVISLSNIEPFVILKEDVFSVHNAHSLVKVLEKIHNYEQLIDEVSKMSGDTIYNTNVNNGGQAVIGGEHATMSQTNFVASANLSTDQRQQVAAFLEDLLKESSKLSGTEIAAAGKVKDAVNKSGPDSENLVLRVAKGINELAGFAKEKGIPLTKFVIENKEKLASLIG